MTHVHAGLPINTPHGVGVVVCVRHDGMVVTKLAGNGGGPDFTGYFHPSTIGLVSPASVGLQGKLAGFPLSTSAVSPPGMFQPVSLMGCGGFQASHMGMAGGGMVNTASSMTVVQPPSQQAFRALDRPCTPPPSKRRRSGGDFAFHR